MRKRSCAAQVRATVDKTQTFTQGLHRPAFAAKPAAIEYSIVVLTALGRAVFEPFLFEAKFV